MRKRLITLSAAILLLTGARDARPTERQRALHALDRLAFGARPGEVDRLLQTGVDVWIDQQLHPEHIADHDLDARLAQLPTLNMTAAQIADRYYRPIVEARQAMKQARSAGAPPPPIQMQLLRRNAQQVIAELVSQRILRATDSRRQLNEVMVDFWLNHFNVFVGKELDRFFLTSYERDTIRPHIWGRFEELLMATAKSPAMLWYLDNARSVADPEHRPPLPRWRATAMGQQQAMRGGLNENYAREIMELHTLGVDGGYTQQDVTELARVFTGWTIARPRQGGGFLFRPALHDAGAKTVLGVRFPPGGGIEEGEKMIRVLARHPATAHHIALQLCQRLVADDPPKALVDRVARRFLATDGDLRDTVKAVITSREFWDPQFYGGKVKSPFEYTISAVRAIDGKVDDPIPLARELQKEGEPLYGSQPPTGYSDAASAWLNTGALLNRLNFALALAANKMPGVHSDVVALIPPEAAADPLESIDALARALTGGELSPATLETIRGRVADRKAPRRDPRDDTQVPMIAGLILGSPEFQRQ